MLNINVYVLVAQSCPTLWDHVDCNPPGSSIQEILQARILEWVASSQEDPGDLSEPGIDPSLPHCRQFLYCLSHQGSPKHQEGYIIPLLKSAWCKITCRGELDVSHCFRFLKSFI